MKGNKTMFEKIWFRSDLRQLQSDHRFDRYMAAKSLLELAEKKRELFNDDTALSLIFGVALMDGSEGREDYRTQLILKLDKAEDFIRLLRELVDGWAGVQRIMKGTPEGSETKLGLLRLEHLRFEADAIKGGVQTLKGFLDLGLDAERCIEEILYIYSVFLRITNLGTYRGVHQGVVEHTESAACDLYLLTNEICEDVRSELAKRTDEKSKRIAANLETRMKQIGEESERSGVAYR